MRIELVSNRKPSSHTWAMSDSTSVISNHFHSIGSNSHVSHKLTWSTRLYRHRLSMLNFNSSSKSRKRGMFSQQKTSLCKSICRPLIASSEHKEAQSRKIKSTRLPLLIRSKRLRCLGVVLASLRRLITSYHLGSKRLPHQPTVTNSLTASSKQITTWWAIARVPHCSNLNPTSSRSKMTQFKICCCRLSWSTTSVWAVISKLIKHNRQVGRACRANLRQCFLKRSKKWKLNHSVKWTVYTPNTQLNLTGLNKSLYKHSQVLVTGLSISNQQGHLSCSDLQIDQAMSTITRHRLLTYLKLRAVQWPSLWW